MKARQGKIGIPAAAERRGAGPDSNEVPTSQGSDAAPFRDEPPPAPQGLHERHHGLKTPIKASLERALIQVHEGRATLQTMSGEKEELGGISLTQTSDLRIHPDWIVSRLHDGEQGESVLRREAENVGLRDDGLIDSAAVLLRQAKELRVLHIDPVRVLGLRLGMERWRRSQVLIDDFTHAVHLLGRDPKWLMHPAILAQIAWAAQALRAATPVDLATAKRAGSPPPKSEARSRMRAIVNALLLEEDPGAMLERVARASEIQAWVIERVKEIGSVKVAMRDAAERFDFKSSAALRQELVRAMHLQNENGAKLPWVGFAFPRRKPRKMRRKK